MKKGEGVKTFTTRQTFVKSNYLLCIQECILSLQLELNTSSISASPSLSFYTVTLIDI